MLQKKRTMTSIWTNIASAVIVAGLILGPIQPVRAQTAYPMLMSLRPIAMQSGQTAEIEIKSRYSMLGAYQVLVSGEGVSGEVIAPEVKQDDSGKKPSVERLKVKFTAAADALPGVRDIRLATPQGVSTVGQLVVVSDPIFVESGNNDTPPQAQQIALPAAICGAIEKAEDVDYFRFQAEAGTSAAFLARCARLQDRIHDLQTHADPIITLRTAAGATLAASDNTSYHADPVLAYRFEQAGEYVLEIRDVRYQGNQYWEYCIEANSRPLVEVTHPLAVRAGEAAALSPWGWLLPADSRVEFTPPTDSGLGIKPFQLSLAGKAISPVSLVVTDLPLIAETDDADDAVESAQAVSMPAGINGRIQQDGDVDCYAFEAQKGEVLSLEVVARRARSALDAHLRVLDAKGKQLALNDDLKLGKRGSADSWIENWTAPADGRYVVEVRDVNLRGGPDFPYFLKLTPSRPYFELYLDTDKTQVSKGGCGAIFVRIERKNGFAGEVQLAIDGLPEGVTAARGRILEGKGQDGCIVLEASADAELAAANVVIAGRATHKLPDGESLELTAVAVPYQETYQPGGGRGHWPVETHTVAITDPADIRAITLSTYDVTLKPGESQKIEVTIDRAEGFTANVTLDMLMRHLNSTFANTLPPGVTLDDKQAKSLLAGSATEGFLTLTAAKDAPPADKQQAVVVAHVALNFVMKWTYASRPVTITVAK